MQLYHMPYIVACVHANDDGQHGGDRVGDGIGDVIHMHYLTTSLVLPLLRSMSLWRDVMSCVSCRVCRLAPCLPLSCPLQARLPLLSSALCEPPLLRSSYRHKVCLAASGAQQPQQVRIHVYMGESF